MIPNPTGHPTMPAKEVASLMGWTPETFSRNKKRLIACEGLPHPLPSGLYWRASILSWFETYGSRKSASIAKTLENSIASLRVNGDREMLEEKYVARNAA